MFMPQKNLDPPVVQYASGMKHDESEKQQAFRKQQ